MNDNIAIDPLLDEVVAKNGEFEYTKRELLRFFGSVENLTNWKLPVDNYVVVENERQRLGVREAVIFFTGSVPTFDRLHSGLDGKTTYRVRADGYYVAIGS